jgi:putative nucleotidyltransferase with HDIG domain
VSADRRPPRLLVKTVAITFVTVALLLATVFVVVWISVRTQVREAVTSNLASSQRMFAALETRRQRELRAEAATLAENPTLKAALDTYQAEVRTSGASERTELLETINREVERLATRVESDAIVLVDSRQSTLASAGRLADQWPRGRTVSLVTGKERDSFDGVAHMGNSVFRVVTVPLVIDDAAIGTLYLATSLDQAYAQELAALAGTKIAILSENVLLASTLTPVQARQFEAAVAARRPADGTILLDDESHAFRRLVDIGDTAIYALGSIDDSSRAATRDAVRSLSVIAIGAIVLAFGASFLLAQMVSKPIGRLSGSLASMIASHDVDSRLPLSGSSRELDTLTDTFNALMASVVAAEAQTQAAYTGAIRALATALDARDPYTAGHSERVGVLSVAISRSLGLPPEEIEVIRLGALLHDIGKIGVPDDVLRKPGALTEAEFACIKTHPVLGARILRSVPFLAPHIPIVELHHERPDGQGYPNGLRGDDIPLAARIVHVADAYDAITSARAYRAARPADEALKELWRCAGTGFHAEIVGALATALPGVVSHAGGVAAVESVGA